MFLVPGLLFGVGLVLSGMSNPAKVFAFLDVSGGAWDPSLAFVMIGAIGTFGFMNFVVHRRERPILGGVLPGIRSRTGISPRLLAGAAIFGIGWGLSGVCPGPAIADVATLRPEVYVFLGAMLFGMAIAQRGFGADSPAAASPPRANVEQRIDSALSPPREVR
ncbi:MAG: YeeE/YedE family protein [Planctomycetes bacterium]|nr:YeeE/YedE family protein [Planctomycetota bacterium]